MAGWRHRLPPTERRKRKPHRAERVDRMSAWGKGGDPVRHQHILRAGAFDTLMDMIICLLFLVQRPPLRSGNVGDMMGCFPEYARRGTRR
jgi:hypothetical protein